MDALSVLLIGVIVSAVTQGMKKVFPGVQPLFWVALLALIGGFLYGVIVPMLPQVIIERSIFSFSIAVGLYETLKAFAPKK